MDKQRLWAREMEQYVANLAVKQVRHSGEWNANITIGLGRVELNRIERRVNRIVRAYRATTIQAHKV